jgi:hypothetical protein
LLRPEIRFRKFRPLAARAGRADFKRFAICCLKIESEARVLWMLREPRRR